jgi:hypothetical protein
MMANGGIMANILATRAPTVTVASRHPVEQRWMPPPMRHCYQSGGFLLCVGACLGLLLCCDADLCSLIVVGLYLFQINGHRAVGAAPCSGEDAG